MHYINIKIYRISNQICKAQELKQTSYRNLQWEMLTSCLHSEVLMGLLAQLFDVIIWGPGYFYVLCNANCSRHIIFSHYL